MMIMALQAHQIVIIKLIKEEHKKAKKVPRKDPEVRLVLLESHFEWLLDILLDER